MDERPLPRPLALALSRLSGSLIEEAARLVDIVGADLLVSMALPPQFRADFIAQAPDQRVPFLQGLSPET